MAGKLADRQQARHKEVAAFAESKTDGAVPAKPKQEPETRSTGKKYVGYYLPADLAKWIKRQIRAVVRQDASRKADAAATYDADLEAEGWDQ